MLHQPRNVNVVFQNKYGLAQTVSPRPAAVEFNHRRAARNHSQINAIRQTNCKRCVNLAGDGKAPDSMPRLIRLASTRQNALLAALTI
jgi:hypothetical protein